MWQTCYRQKSRHQHPSPTNIPQQEAVMLLKFAVENHRISIVANLPKILNKQIFFRQKTISSTFFSPTSQLQGGSLVGARNFLHQHPSSTLERL